MSHAITIGGLLLSIGLLGGVVTFGLGMLALFAESMSDAQGDGGKGGCIALIVGAVLVIGCGVGLVV